jgi:transposase
MKAVERRKRNAAMAERKAAGASYSELAREFGVARSTAQRAIADHAAESPTLLLVGTRPSDLDVEAMFMRVIRAHVGALDRMEELLERSRNNQTQIGAARTVVRAGEGLVRLLALVGLIPNADEVLLLRARAKRARDAAKDEGERVLIEGNVAA